MSNSTSFKTLHGLMLALPLRGIVVPSLLVTAMALCACGSSRGNARFVVDASAPSDGAGGDGSSPDASTGDGPPSDAPTSGDADAGCACKAPGQACVGGQCVLDCRAPGANPCPSGTACDVSEANPGKCEPPGTACLTTSAPEACGTSTCGPGSTCDGKGQCYPRVPCTAITCSGGICYGTGCACTRKVDCAPAAVGTAGATGTLNDPTFSHGLVDLRFDPTCTAWGVTLLSGPDYLRSLAPDGGVGSIAGVTNLDMGEVAVLQNDVANQVDVSLTYICCSTCGCQLSTTPQGAAHYEPATMTIPLVIQSMMFTTGTGPFGGPDIDTGPEGLAYGLNTVIYLGNVNTNGDYYSLDLTGHVETLVTTFPARVYSSTAWDLRTMLVALEGGALVQYRLTDGKTTPWTTSSSPVTSVVRDLFDGSVYVARADLTVWRYDASGSGASFQTIANPARLAVGPDGWLYAVEIPSPFHDHQPLIERWQLPTTR